MVTWDDSRFIWDLTDLEHINKEKKLKGEKPIEIVKKHPDVDLGIRAHPQLGIGKCLLSIFMPHHNEFIFIWLFLGFTLYFWIEAILAITESPTFGLKN